MRPALLLGLTLALLACACSSSDDKTDPPGTPQDAAVDQDGATAQETGLAACPNEIDLKTVTLPCDCYGHEANATTIVDPGCKTQVVCCPTISNLRCEDHEYCDDAGNCWDAATVPDASSGDAAAKCPDEVDLSTTTLPCDCYGTVVTDPKVSMPSCTAKVMCCPADKGLKCE
ncbi:MAG: hypothetical protein HY898_11240 [Deltaproteobacteria bacterium]|nr:hypothetical protein [Deltaproteobacteria bacterium]